MKLMFQEREFETKLSISQKPDSTLTGAWISQWGEHVVYDVKFQDGKLTFARKSKFGDRELESTYEGTLKGHKITGKIKSEMGEMAANGQRASSALVGKWELRTTSDRVTFTNTLKIKEGMTGTYTVRDNEIDITNLSVEGDRLTFKVTMRFGEREFPMEFKGRLDGTALKGEFITSRGSREATSKKVD